MFRLVLASLALALFQGAVSQEIPKGLRGARRLQDAEAPAAEEAPAAVPAEAPEAPAEAPAVATEAPAVATEAPAVATEAPAVATEAPAEEAGGITAAEQAQLNRDFIRAIRSMDTATAETLLANGADIDDVSTSGPRWTPLAEACVGRDSARALWLLEHGADPDFADNRGRTPLYHAVHYYLHDAVEEMLKTAKNLSPHDGDGVDMLTRAVWQNDARMVEMLLAAGATSAAAQSSASGADWEIQKLFGYTSTVAPLVVTEAPAETPILP